VTISSVAQPAARLGRPLGTGRDWRRRLLLHHVPLALASAVLLLLFVGLSPFTEGKSRALGDIFSGTFPSGAGGSAGGQAAGLRLSFDLSTRQFTTATGYVATVLLALTLLVGPANMLLRRRNPVSSYLRRDIGLWTAGASVVHVVLGLQVHGVAGDAFAFIRYFFAGDGTPLTNSFGWANWTGLAALVIAAALLALSTDGALRELSPKPWKRLQRLNYALFVLVVAHAFFYGALLRATSPFTLMLIITVVTVLLGQTAGIYLWRRRVPGAATLAVTSDDRTNR
jgi:methionine sulfoxide reductase heme-binding subunit